MSPAPPLTDLPTRRLGDSPLQVSLVGLGCNNFGRRLGPEATAAVLDAALAAGVTLFDTADIYGEDSASERLMGEALAGRRDEFVLATKFGMQIRGAEGVPEIPRGSREYIRWAVEGSLRRLRVDRIDLYQYHQPDGVTPIAETLAALDELVGEGVVTAIGCSNFSATELEAADRVLLPARKGAADRQVPARRAGAAGHPPGGRRADRQRGAVRGRRGDRGLRGGARGRAHRRRRRRARRAAGDRLGDRRRHPSRAGRRQRRRPALAAERDGSCRARSDRADPATLSTEMFGRRPHC